MIFVDTSVFMYAVGRSHPLQEPAREMLKRHASERSPMATSAEVLQELLHAYLPVERMETLDAALTLATRLTTVWPIEPQDVLDARALHHRHPALSARDLIHLAVCVRRDADDLLTLDRGLALAWGT